MESNLCYLTYDQRLRRERETHRAAITEPDKQNRGSLKEQQVVAAAAAAAATASGCCHGDSLWPQWLNVAVALTERELGDLMKVGIYINIFHVQCNREEMMD